MTDFIYGVGDAIYWFFSYFEQIGNVLNYSIIVLAFVLLFWWMKMQKDYNDKAASDPNQLK